MSASEDLISLRYASFREFLESSAGGLSDEGMFVATDQPRPAGSKVRFELTVGDDFMLFRGVGEVAWARDAATSRGADPGMAIRFDDVADPGKRLLDKVVRKFEEDGVEPFVLAARPAAPAEETAPEAVPAPGPQPPPDPAAGETRGAETTFEEFLRQDSPSSGVPGEAVDPVAAVPPAPSPPATESPAPPSRELEIPGLGGEGTEPVPEQTPPFSEPLVDPVPPAPVVEGSEDPVRDAVIPETPIADDVPPREEIPEAPDATLPDAAVSDAAPPEAAVPAAGAAEAVPPGPGAYPEGLAGSQAARVERRSGGRRTRLLALLLLTVAVAAAYLFRDDIARVVGIGSSDAETATVADPDALEPVPVTPEPESDVGPAPTVPEEAPPPDAGLEAPAGEPAVAEPDAEAEELVGEESAIAEADFTYVEEILWRREGDVTVIVIRGDGPVPPESVSNFRVDVGRPREVVEIFGVARPFRGGAVEIGDGNVLRVRNGYRREEGGVLRLVADLTGAEVRLRSLEVEGSRIVVTLSGGSR